ncbi:MAG: hypothetical protein ACI8QD_001582 [Cyclobacteriaceae bacterium]|jgi:hypothetical protein
MDRRETLKSMFVGSVAGGLVLSGCSPADLTENRVSDQSIQYYGRTAEEVVRDQRLQSTAYFDDHELLTIAVLCDIILPPAISFVSATTAQVPDFIAFIVRDLPVHQLPLRGGLRWLDSKSLTLFEKTFIEGSEPQQIELIEMIAYPKPKEGSLLPGVRFFERLRNLTMTGYYTSKEGIEALGYQGNVPNVWDGVPSEVLIAHGLSYDPEWLKNCVDQSKRNIEAKWDDEGNLIS